MVQACLLCEEMAERKRIRSKSSIPQLHTIIHDIHHGTLVPYTICHKTTCRLVHQYRQRQQRHGQLLPPVSAGNLLVCRKETSWGSLTWQQGAAQVVWWHPSAILSQKFLKRFELFVNHCQGTDS